MPDRHGPANQPAVRNPSAKARAARVAKFERETLIIDLLNDGASVADIAAEIGIGEKRTRAVIRDPRTRIRGLGRRMPRPPEAFVAIQVSRLNEALLMAYSAMSPTNLKAVDEVVKIVRELDRYGGAFAAEWARPEASPRVIPGSQPGDPGLDSSFNESLAFGGAWVCSADLALQDFGATPANLGAGHRPENLAQGLERIESAPGIAKDPLALPGLLTRGGRRNRSAIARKFPRNALKWLNPRPELGRPDGSAGAATPRPTIARAPKAFPPTPCCPPTSP